MTKRFRPWDPKQKWLLPPEITEFIPEGHASHFVRDLVVEQLDLSAIIATYVEDRGFPPFHPAMKACIERMDFAAVTGFQKPDFRTIGLFRRRHLQSLAGLFQQVLVICRRAGLVTLGHVALDGTKVKANASKHKAMSYDRMVKADSEFAEVVKDWLDQAEVTDLGEDSRFKNRQGDELPDWVVNKVERMKRIRLGRKPNVCSADAGYCSEKNLEGMATRKIRTYIATGRQKHGTKAATHVKNGKPGSLIAAMRDRLKRGGWRSPYRLRKQVVGFPFFLSAV